MPYRTEFTKRSARAVNDTLEWLGNRSPEAADQFFDQLQEQLQKLRDNPERYPSAEEAAEFGFDLREATFGKKRSVYRVLFTIEGEFVRITHVRRATMDKLGPEDF